jgi:DNA-binding response OmpR family regulator
VLKKVLIVEDDKALARALQRVVQAEGYGVSVVHDGAAATESLREDVPGLVLLDLLLPKKDGRAVLEWIRERDETRELPVVVMSGVLKSRGHANDFLEAGAKEFLDKPFRRSEVSAVLRRHLGRPEPTQLEPSRPGAVLLTEQPVARVLWDLVSRSFTGAVEFRSRKRIKVLVLKDGTPISIRSNLAKECLGQRLAAEGLITNEQLDESVKRLKSQKGSTRQGKLLVEMGAITGEQLEEQLASQARDKLLQLFGWGEGEALARERMIEVAQATQLSGWKPRRLILEGVESMSASLAQKLLGDCGERTLPRDAVKLEAGEAELCGVSRLLGALDEALAVRDLLVDHARVLYGLDLVGAARIGTATDRTAAGPNAGGGVQVQELRERLDRVHELAKRFHPDRVRDDETRMLAADLFGRMSEAHETLVHPSRREAYLQSLAAKRDGSDGPVTTAIVAAELQFQRGEVLYKKRDYREALRNFTTALELNDQEGEFHAYFGWTQLLCNPDDEEAQRKAKEHLERAVKLAPRSVTGYYFLGLHRKACGDAEMAERMFRKVLEIQPSHVEASREMRLAAMRREKRPNEGGLFGLGRKK